MKYRVVLADDERGMRNLLEKLINTQCTDFEIVGSFPNGKLALEYLEKEPCHVLITDIRMPVMDGLQLAEVISCKQPNLIIVILSAYGEFSYAQKAISIGVFNYLLKPVASMDLKDCLGRIRERLIAQTDAPKGNENITATDPVESVNDEVINAAMRYVETHYAQQISRDSAAEAVFLSPSYFGRCFMQATGRSFGDYLRKVRIQKAVQFLQEGKLPIRQIAARVGFSDPRYFSDSFKRETGYLPSEYRRKFLAPGSAEEDDE